MEVRQRLYYILRADVVVEDPLVTWEAPPETREEQIPLAPGSDCMGPSSPGVEVGSL